MSEQSFTATKAVMSTEAERNYAKRLRKYGPKATTTFRRNFLPVLLGLSVMAVVLGAMNAQLIIAQLKYRLAKPVATSSQIVSSQLVSTSPTTSSAAAAAPQVEQAPRVVIPGIQVDAPLQFDQGTAEWQIQVGLRNGVVHYDTSAKPGDAGNVVLFGHSSGQLFAPGDYKFVFTLLNKVAAKDVIYIDYKGTRYGYKVVSSQVVAPTDTGILAADTAPENPNELILITCTPVGTSKNRLVVHAEQISPVPAKVTSASQSSASNITALPGSAR